MKNNQKILLGIGILTIIGIVLISRCLNSKTLLSYPAYISSNSTLTPLQICKKISEKEPKDMCFAWINESNNIKDEDLEIYYVAIQTNNTSLCGNIKSLIET